MIHIKKIITALISLFFSLHIFAQYPFTEIPYQSLSKKIIIDKHLSYKILFRMDDSVWTKNNTWAKAKGSHDMILAMPGKDSLSYSLAISHECNTASKELGDGGSMSIVPIRFSNDTWSISDTINNIDFSSVGGTYDNCSGTYIPGKKTLLTAEEGTPANNVVLYKKGKGYTDTSDINGLKRFQNTGWMVEVDPNALTSLRKLYGMGRFVHESALVLDDGKTVYLTDDFAPSVFFKFVAKEKYNFEEGQLYAYKDAIPTDTTHWITLPMMMDSLIDIRNVALRMGASYFLRMEWMTKVDDIIYITATGNDYFDAKICFNGKPSKHLLPFIKDGIIDEPYGTLLAFNLKTNEMTTVLNGGQAKHANNKHFSNPDAITNVTINGKTYLVISEDIIANARGRVSRKALKKGLFVNEIYWLDLSVSNPTVDDLKRFLIAPAGAETTGGEFIQGNSRFFFVNIQHPDSSNPEPFNKSCTIVIDLKNKNK